MSERPTDPTRRLYDGGPADGAPDPSAPPRIVLERTEGMAAQDFRLRRRIAYLDRELGELLVPADPSTFVTDLTSVPSAFAWLVPRTGEHLPAALVHDGLVGEEGEDPSYLGPPGVVVRAEEAHRVFRDALADSGTGPVRRWLMWTAVTLATMVTGTGTGWSVAERWRWRLTAVGSLVLLALLGLAATADLVDVDLPLVGGVPWMGAGPWWEQVATGAAGAVVIPLVLGLMWGRFRLAGVISGITLALLLHVTVVVALLTGLYQALEWLSRRSPRIALGLGAVLVGGAVLVFLAAW